MDRNAQPSRRRVLRALALTSLTPLLMPWAEAAAANVGLITPSVCMVAPELTAGPFYLDPDLVRSDITEGRPGAAMDLALQVVTADCAPVAGARVDLWHCDAEGNYSGFARQGSDRAENTRGETFLRGTQFTGANGVASFRTIYPGWYQGRTTHFHYKVFLDDRTVLTSQIFLPDAVSAAVYSRFPPYNARSSRQKTFNRNDSIARQAGDGAYAAVREEGNGFSGASVVGIAA